MAESDSFLPHSHMIQDLGRARDMGPEAYGQELRGRMDFLAYLLKNYNDGRRKTFFILAVYLLPWEDLKVAAARIPSLAPLSLPLKQRAIQAVAFLNSLAATRNISLKLKKKQSNERGSNE